MSLPALYEIVLIIIFINFPLSIIYERILHYWKVSKKSNTCYNEFNAQVY